MKPSAPEHACNECRIRKVRCDRKSPLCSSCRKSGLVCQYIKGKRIDHTKKLVNDVQSLAIRLQRFEEALVRFSSSVQASTSPLSNFSTTYYSPNSRRSSVWGLCSNFSTSEESQTDKLVAEPLGGDGYEQSSSIYTEAQAAGDQFALSLPPSNSPGLSIEAPSTSGSLLQAQIARLSALFQRLAKDKPPLLDFPQYDDQPSRLPPRAFLETFIDTYFTELNPLLPIYDRQSVLTAMRTQYETMDVPDPAWIVSLNSILLQTLEGKSTAAKKTGMIPLEAGLITYLLQNIRQCFNNFQILLEPRMANVQALLSLALFALKYLQFTMFEALFTQACELAKSMGLHRSKGKPCAEGRNLFWSLFIIDKHISLIIGTPCLLPSYDIGLPLPTSSGMLLSDQFDARISLARIQERISRSLYASIPRVSRKCLRRRAYKLVRRLNDWTTQHSHILYPPASTTTTAQQAIELRYALCICHVLVQRCIPALESRQARLEHARTGLQLLQELCESYHPGDSISGFSMFESILLRYPIVPFLEIYIHLLNPEDNDSPAVVTSDVNALVFFAKRAECLATNACEGSHAETIRSISQLCSQIVTSILQQNRRLQAQTTTPHGSESSCEQKPSTPNSYCVDYGGTSVWGNDFGMMMDGHGSYHRYDDVWC
ncbi:Zn(II)2Cys6 transcription factor [Aspergillus tubingensis]|uniref:Zn(II)2Cys6 transcription factor n=1 Tax=Aspergillus tubingensis TaxID=5068 RepID=UPI001577EDE7|nr:C6 transcription factor [Aspergillus tubingensis]GFN21100.1 C6 transcription factor [Aspergillus tubingensis]